MFIFQVTKVAEEGSIPKSDRHKTDIYFHSPNIAVRILSSFIILKTLSRGENSAINKTDVLIQFTLGREKLGQGRTRTIKVTSAATPSATKWAVENAYGTGSMFVLLFCSFPVFVLYGTRL